MNAVLRGKFPALSAYIKKLENSHTSDFTVHMKILQQKEAATPKRSRQQEIIKSGLKKKQNRNKEGNVKNQLNKSWFFEKINKKDKPLYLLTKRHRLSTLTKSKRKWSHNDRN